MVFSSLTFLCVFLPITYLLHLIIPWIKGKNALLLVASILFYAYGEPAYILLMAVSVLINYAGAILISKNRFRSRDGDKAGSILAITLAIDIGILCVFKYTGFLLRTWDQLTHMKIKDPGIPLPIGISFFTFQAMSYVIDVYRGKAEAQGNFARVFLYISFFPQLIAGPIVKYRDIALEIKQREMTIDETARGLRRFIGGLGKKVLIANTMGLAADNIFQAGGGGFLAAWVGALAYMFQIYYDFSGYSDMAIGLGKMFGFHFKENFQYPYAASSMKEFWRRWHISLSSWFREYVYIPLGGNRKGRTRTVANKMMVFFLTGLWHGANWTFVLWGLYHGFFLLLEEYIPCLRRLPKTLGTAYAALVTCLGFVMFRADQPGQGLSLIRDMFRPWHNPAAATSLACQQLSPWFLFMLACGLIGAGPVKKIAGKLRNPDEPVYQKASRILYPLSLALFAWCLIRLSASTYNPFIYFRF